MIRRDVAGRKVTRATSLLNDVDALLARGREHFLTNVKERDLATFYLFLAIQECMDLAAHWVADAGWGVPEDASSTFDLLADRDAIDRNLANGMRAAAGLRNRIAHGYAALDHQRLYDEAQSGLTALRAFLVKIAAAAGL
jgi:uncharacterized protein YutE (UPF0331/DUF86 family)